MSQTKAQLIDAVDGSIVSADIADQAVTLDKLPHGTSSNNGKFLRANNGADPSFETVTETTINNNADNRIITGSGTANTLNGEANLTFDGGNLQLNADANTEGISIVSTGNTYNDINLDANRSGADNHIGRIVGKWNGGRVASIIFNTGGDTTGKDDGELLFATSNGGSSPTTRMNIKQDGKIGIGTTSPSRNLDVVGTLGIKNTSGAQWYVDRNDSNGRFELYQSNGTGNDGRKLNVTTDGQLEVGQVETEAGRGRVAIKAKNDDGGTAVNLYLQEVSGGEGYGLGVDAAGDLNFYNSGGTTPSFEIGDDNNVTITNGNLIIGTGGKGIDFSAQTATSKSGASTLAEVLDHYEEGTFTPTQPTVGTTGTAAGHYTRIGDLVTAQLICQIPANSSGHDLVIDGLPFNGKNGTDGNFIQGGAVTYTDFGVALMVLLSNNSDRLVVYRTDTGNRVILTDFDNRYLRIFISYKIA